MGAPGLAFETSDPLRKYRQTNLEKVDQIQFSRRLESPGFLLSLHGPTLEAAEKRRLLKGTGFSPYVFD